MGEAERIDGLMRKTRGAWYEDGLADITLGGYALVIGLMLAAQGFTPKGSSLWTVWSVAAPVVLLLGGAMSGWAMRRLKTRLVYPRAGYVSCEKKGTSGLARMLLTLAIGAAVGASTAVISGKLANLSLVFGLVMGGVLFYVWQRVGLRRYLALAGWSVAAGAAIVSLPLSMDLGGALFWALAGAGLLISGFVAWRRFDREAPTVEASNEAGS